MSLLWSLNVLILLHGHPVSDSHSTDYDDDYYNVCSCLQSMSVKDYNNWEDFLD